MMRRLGIIAMVVIALTLAGCTTSTAKPTGVVTVAYACVGAPLAVGEVVRVNVSLYSGSKPVTSEKVGSRYKYRLVVAPGTYTVRLRQQTGTEVSQPYSPKVVVVRAGETTTANFPEVCI